MTDKVVVITGGSRGIGRAAAIAAAARGFRIVVGYASNKAAADEVVEQIEGLVLEGVLRVGDRLPGERELARQFEVSRPILRDALKRLETRGLLVTRPGGGTHVADVIGQVFARPVLELIATRRKAAADYLEYRREIEGIAADYAARRATTDDLALLDAIVERMEAAHQAGDFAEWLATSCRRSPATPPRARTSTQS